MFNTQLVAPGQQMPFAYPNPYGQPQGGLLPQGYPQRFSPNCQIHVSGFEDTVTGSMLFERFQRFGRIIQFIFPINHDTKRARGYAFITYMNPADAQKAITESNHQKLLVNPIRVVMYKQNIKDLPKEANLFLNNLNDIEEQDIEEWLKQEGITGVVSLKIPYDNGRSKGYGYMQFDNIKIFNEVLNRPIKIKEHEIVVKQFQPKSQRPMLKNNLYIKNLPDPQEIGLASEDDLMEHLVAHFREYGKVSSYLIKRSTILDPVSNRMGLFAFICYQDDEERNAKATDCAQVAMFSLNGQDIFNINKGLEIHFLEKKSERMKRIMENNLYTNNLREDLKEADVYKVYSSFGVITRYTVRRPNPERSVKVFKTQYAMIQFSTKAEANKAFKEAPQNSQVQDLYPNKTVFLNYWMDHETRARVKQAKYNSGRFNKQLYGIPTEPQGAVMGSMGYTQPQMQFAPQPQFGYSQHQQLGAPTVSNTGAPMNPGFNAPQYNNPLAYQPYQQGQQFNKQPRTNYGTQRPRPPRVPMPRQNVFPNMNNNMPNKMPQQQQQPIPAMMQQQMRQMPPPQQQELPFSRPQLIRTNMEKFLSLPQENQRSQLGEMIMPQVQRLCDDQFKGEAAKITGMLIDFSVFQVEDILEMLENPAELLERIREAQTLLQSSTG